MPDPVNQPLYSDRLLDALQTAARLHATQVRKGTTIPYLTHLLGTCSIALEFGANEDQAIAALLHDVIEDVEPVEMARAEVGRFGPEVLRIVEACTDSDAGAKPPWRERKERYMAHLPQADAAILLVSASDKLHNSRTIVTDLQGKQWTETSGSETVELSPIEANWRLADVERHPLVLLGAHARGQLLFRLLATQRHDDRDFVLLEAVTDRFERLRLQIDRESGLVRIVEAWSTSPEGLPTRTVDTWSDYRTIDGVRAPFRRITVVDDGQSRRVADFERVQPTTRAD